MMERTFAEFNAIMGMTGYTCNLIARDLGTTEGAIVDSIYGGNGIPDEVWGVLDAARERQRKYVRSMLGIALMDEKPVELPYARENAGDLRVVNANNLAAAYVLMANGIDVLWVDSIVDMPDAPDPEPVVSDVLEMGLKDALRYVVESTGKSQREISLALGKRDTWLNQAITRQKSISTERVAYIASLCGWELRFRKRGTDECIVIDDDSEE